ncbi:MAG: ABC transporter ATP-binding protein [Actinobacteria bacterium]|nr:ABC transporter ATP-binding protein [Actinomycetota bacterium]
MSDSTVVARDLAVGYGARPTWSGADFELGAGEFVAVLGPNGAGKSTLLRAVLGLLPPLAGDLRVLGGPPRRGNPAIGYVPQHRELDTSIALTGRDVVGLGVDGHRWGARLAGTARRQVRKSVDEAVAAVGATAYVDRRVGNLSGGEPQRLLLAQSLVRDPRILLLDEPLSNLDMRNQSAIAGLVSRIARERNVTVLLVEHDVNPLLPVVDRVIYVAGGSVAIGTPDEVVQPATLSRLYGTPVEVLRDSRGRIFVVGLEAEASHPHA